MARLASRPTNTYRGTTTVNHNTGAGQNITTDVDITSLGLASLGNSAEKLKGFTNNGLAVCQARLGLTSPTNLRIVTYSSLNNYTITVEWEIETGPSLQVVRVTTGHVSGVVDYVAETNETIASVGDTGKAEAICNGATCNGGPVNAKVKLTSATNLKVTDSVTFPGAGIQAQSVVLRRAA
jgi:hypothetical protein